MSCRSIFLSCIFFFFFNDTATTEIYTLSLHDALPICRRPSCAVPRPGPEGRHLTQADRKSTRLNSSHTVISYAVFCLKKKNKTYNIFTPRYTALEADNKYAPLSTS